MMTGIILIVGTGTIRWTPMIGEATYEKVFNRAVEITPIDIVHLINNY